MLQRLMRAAGASLGLWALMAGCGDTGASTSSGSAGGSVQGTGGSGGGVQGSGGSGGGGNTGNAGGSGGAPAGSGGAQGQTGGTANLADAAEGSASGSGGAAGRDAGGGQDAGGSKPPDSGSVSDAAAAFKGRIALSSDGNQHDTDDWGAQAIGLAILAKAGLQSKVVHFDYDDHIWDSSTGWPAQEKESVFGGAQRFGFDTAVFFDDLSQLQGAVDNIAKVVNESTADNPLVFILAGPMEVAYRGLMAAQPAARKFVRCVSHSSWNDTHATGHGGHAFTDLTALGCVGDHIPDQNQYLGVQANSNWAWLQAGDANLQWVYGRIAAEQSGGDVSDAGMVYYTVTGDKAGTVAKLRTFFGL
jgi:hypothetical protein